MKGFIVKLENSIASSISPLSPEEIKKHLEEFKPVPGNWTQLLTAGYHGKHPRYGKIEYTSENLDTIHDNIKNNTIGRKISFNYNHYEKSMAISTLEDVRKVLNEKGKTIKLEYLPFYTPTGYKLVNGNEYKYGSVEVADNYEDNFGNRHGMTLLNAGATNDPFLIDEAMTKLENTKEEKIGMDKDEKEKLEKEQAEKEAKIAKLEADLAEAKKLDADRVIRLEQSETNRLTSDIKAWKLEKMSMGIPVNMISMGEKRILESKNQVVKLSNTVEPSVNLMKIYDEIFSLYPNEKRVHLNQDGDSKKLERGSSDEEDIKALDAYTDEINKRGSK